MRRAEGVVGALRPLGEAVEAAGLTYGADAIAPPGDDLVRIGLVAHVPDQAVVGRAEHVVEGDRQLDHAEACAEMAARRRDRVDRFGAQLRGDFPELLDREAAQIRGVTHAVQIRRLRHRPPSTVPAGWPGPILPNPGRAKRTTTNNRVKRAIGAAGDLPGLRSGLRAPERGFRRSRLARNQRSASARPVRRDAPCSPGPGRPSRTRKTSSCAPCAGCRGSAAAPGP